MQGIEELPRDALIRVLSLTEGDEERREVLPMVCKNWAAASAVPSELWRQVKVDSEEHLRKVGGRLRWAQLRRWLEKRAGGFETLTLRLHHAAPPGGLAPLYPLLAPRLRTLDLELERVLPPSRCQADLSGLAALINLRSLKLIAPSAPARAVAGGLEAGLAGLTALQELSLALHSTMFTALRPEFPVALGCLTGLLRLTLDVASFAPAAGGALPAALSRMTALQGLELRGDWRHTDAAFPPRFEDLPALRELSLRQLNLLEAAPPVTGLLALRCISLQDCTGRFFVAAGLSSLQQVDIDRCDRLQFSRGSQDLLARIEGLAINVAIRDDYVGEVPQWMLDCPAVHLLDRRTRK